MGADMSLDFSLYVKTQKSKFSIYEKNITHNLSLMAKEVGVYEILWQAGDPFEHPDYPLCHTVLAKDMIELLQYCLLFMSDPKIKKRLLKLEPENKWGSLESLKMFVAEVLEVCKEFPEAIAVSEG